jgi:hypothetical protein
VDNTERSLVLAVDLGMPSAASFALRAYPVNVAVTPAEGEWLVRRAESQFLWSRGGHHRLHASR